MTIDETRFLEWAESPGRARRPLSARPRVFYSYWMDQSNTAAEDFLSEFRELVATQAEVVTGKSDRSPPLADAIREAIRGATMTIVQLHPLRPTIGLEIGWSMGASKPLLLAMTNPSELADFPSWITGTFEIQSNGMLDQRATFARATLKILDAVAAGDSSVQWKIESDGTPSRHYGAN